MAPGTLEEPARKDAEPTARSRGERDLEVEGLRRQRPGRVGETRA